MWSKVGTCFGVQLQGRTIDLIHLSPSHAEALWPLVGGTSDPNKASTWTYLPEGPYPEADFDKFQASVTTKCSSTDPLFYAIVDKSQQVLGWITLMSIVPEQLRLEIGWVLFSPALQRTTGATEASYLLLKYAFEELGYRRVEWKCNALNEGSKRAAERLGFVFEGVFRQHMVVKGRNRDTAWFSMLKEEWDSRGVKEALEGWLAEENFDESGAQRRGLEGIKKEILGRNSKN
ncbi:GNAT family acetyltransferase [Aspergillus nomiae NRRL 13137]|uniref:GNAT family acetyltransferase n=1 Tax=Aspergillus nomiae NRRL (strain ATCC 15546 / NRRL 13137 / CBS 260.88 / M93) TaxID=1509407 RepID=A0A0L1J5C3_ASPN3|nr:GNAT family acetyltransferase [Aspergillus nomiae NRRL 13137]KNG86628.1 GNAT family acetyltransferase [Aspergillus nomiae NRRL 13137]